MFSGNFSNWENVTDTATFFPTIPDNQSNCLGRTRNVTVYSSYSMVVLIVLITVFCCFSLFGNVSVIIAILKDRVISKHKQHLYLLSLAVADALLVVLVVPFSLTNELLGEWPFGDVYCRIYLSVDILLCTASICNICCIGIDRYISVKYPTKYKKHRRLNRIRRGIIFVWIYAAAVSLLPFTGKTEIIKGVKHECFINDSSWFIVVSSSLSFFLPTCGIGAVYINIFFIGRGITERNLKRKNFVALNSPTNALRKNIQASENAGQAKYSKSSATLSTYNSCRENNCSASPQLTSRFPENYGAEIKLTKDGTINPNPGQENEEAGKVYSQIREKPMLWRYGNNIETPTNTPLFKRKSIENEDVSSLLVTGNVKTGGFHVTSFKRENNQNIPLYARKATYASCKIEESRKEQNKFVSFLRSCCNKIRSQSKSKTEVNVTTLAPSSAKGESDKLFSRGQFQTSTWGSSKRRKDSALVKHASTLASLKGLSRSRREKRFIFIILVVTGFFLFCWTPFFTIYFVYSVCREMCCIDKSMFKFFFWLGYLNSGINPVLYTIFNKDFRQAFKRLFSNKS